MIWWDCIRLGDADNTIENGDDKLFAKQDLDEVLILVIKAWHLIL